MTIRFHARCFLLTLILLGSGLESGLCAEARSAVTQEWEAGRTGAAA